MFRWSIIVGGLATLLLAIFVALGIVRSSPLDRQHYFELLESSRAASEREAPQQALSASQRRDGVQKTIWYMDGTQRLQIKVLSDQAELRFERADGHERVIEHMQGIRCWMQERLYEQEGIPMQVIRYFEAEEADYLYRTGTLEASAVQLIEYHAQGHTLQENETGKDPVMTGKARGATLQLREGSFDFHAHQLRAIFYQQDEKLV